MRYLGEACVDDEVEEATEKLIAHENGRKQVTEHKC